MPESPNEDTNPYKVLTLLRRKAVTGMDILIELGILSYNVSIHKLSVVAQT